MRKIRLFAHLSLDGMIQPGGPDEESDHAHGGWTAPYRNAVGAEALAEIQGADFDLLLGRRTYDLWSKFWPTVKDGPFANGLNAATKYVATHRPETLGWGPVGSLGAEVMDGIRRLKSQDGPDLIVWGSAMLAQSLFAQGLVDELTLAIYPVVFGQGKRLFADGAGARELTLTSTQATPTGVLINVYRPAGLSPVE